MRLNEGADCTGDRVLCATRLSSSEERDSKTIFSNLAGAKFNVAAFSLHLARRAITLGCDGFSEGLNCNSTKFVNPRK